MLHSNNPRVKFFFFRDMVENHEWLVRQMAEFMEVPNVDDDLIATVVSQSTHAYMSSDEHRHRCVPPRRACVCTAGVMTGGALAVATRFTDRMVVRRLRESRFLPPLGDVKLTGKVRKSGGKAGKGRALLTPAQRSALQRAWDVVVKRDLGFNNLEEMREAWRQERAAAQ